MKFSAKLTLYITFLIFILFSLGGHLMIQQNFNYAFREASAQYIKGHISQRVLLENELYNSNADVHSITNENLIKAAETIGQFKGIGLYDQNVNKIYSSLVVKDIGIIRKLIKSDKDYIVDECNDNYVMATFTPLSLTDDEQIYMVSVYDITDVFSERRRQYANFLYLDVMILVIAAISVAIFAKLITLPLKRLTLVSEKIADGAYDQRTNIFSKDEIGVVAKSFDKMAEAVEGKICELQETIRAKDDFVSNFTHELKTPMTSIMGYADMLRSHENEQEIQIKAADHIYKESKRLGDLSLKLMDLMSLSGEYIQIEPIAATKLLNEFNADMEKATVLADKTLIQCVLRNLCQNAENAGADEIRVTGKTADNRYIISVCDNGSGILQNELNRIVEPFYMVDKSRSREKGGSGLGLALCEKILRLHGTSLTIKSTMGIGTIISFELEVCH